MYSIEIGSEYFHGSIMSYRKNSGEITHTLRRQLAMEILNCSQEVSQNHHLNYENPDLVP